jgi:PmbA protein
MKPTSITGAKVAFGETHLQLLAARVLEFARDMDSQVTVMAHTSHLTRFANNQVHQHVCEQDLSVEVEVSVEGRLALCRTNDTSESGLRQLIAQVRHLALVQPPDPHFPGFAKPAVYARPAALKQTTLAFSPQDRANVVKHVCGGAERVGLVASGAFATGVHEVAIANHHGLWAYHAHTLADFNTVVMSDDSSGWAAMTDLDASLVCKEALAEEAIDKALRSRRPVSLEPGHYTVILEEYAVLDLLQYLGMGANAQRVLEGRSFMARGTATPVLHPGISIWDDGLDPTGIPSPFDAEGMPRQKVQLVDAGRILAPVTDRRSAERLGCSSSGHRSRGSEFFGSGPQAANLFMAPGTHSKEAMLESTERGIWVTRFHYCNQLDTKQTLLTGMTRDGTFLIEDGRLTKPLQNMRFTHRITDALQRVDLIGNTTKLERNYFDGGNRAPALRIHDFRFSGRTTF